MHLPIEEVTRDPETVFKRVREGESVIVTDSDLPVAEIRPIQTVSKPRPFGLARGLFEVPDDFDAPLPDEVLREFE